MLKEYGSRKVTPWLKIIINEHETHEMSMKFYMLQRLSEGSTTRLF